MEFITDKLVTSERRGRARGESNPSRTYCTYCKKREPSNPRPDQKLKRCSRCRTSVYCSRACQRADWKRGHRRTCISGAIMARNSCYLDGLQSEEMVMDQLVDAYRLRVEDERVYCGRLRGRYNTVDTARMHTYTADAADNQALQYALQDFQDFLDLAESDTRNSNNEERHDDGNGNGNENAYDDEDMSGGSSSPSSSTTMNTDTDNSSSSSPPSTSTIPTNETTKRNTDTAILPQWWNAEKRALCEARASDGSGDIWSNLGRPAGKDDILNHYLDNLMPMKLRMLAERVYGSDVMGQSRL